MKKIALVTSVFFFSTFLFSQSDIIYPSKNNKNIRRCIITEVKNINVVYYEKGTKTDIELFCEIVRLSCGTSCPQTGILYRETCVGRRVGIIEG